MTDFDKETRIGEIFEVVLTEDERNCIEEIIGTDAYEELLAASTEDTGLSFEYFPADCLSPEHYDDLLIGTFAATADGLSAETLECVRGIYAESTADDFAYRYFGMTLCFSEEEVIAFLGEDTGDDNWVMPPPAVLRCAEEEVGLRAIADAFTGTGDGPAMDAVVRCADAYRAQRDGAPDGGSDARPSSSLGGLTITLETTGHDLTAALSESEAECVRTSQSAWTAGTFIDAPLVESITLYGAGYFPFTCLTPDSMADLGIGVVSAQAGGLSSETLSCLDDYFAGFPSIPEPEGTIWKQHGPFTMNFIVCLSDEESDAQPDAGGDGPAFQPSTLQCMLLQPGAKGALSALMSASDDSPPDPDALQALAAAGIACQ